MLVQPVLWPGTLIVSLGGLAYLYWIWGTFLSPAHLFLPTTVAITHVVLFQFRPDATTAQIRDTSLQMFSLRDRCIRPDTKLPYIRSITGGRDNSPERLQDGLTHAFIVEFNSIEDRNYYVYHDPNHKLFKSRANSFVERMIVVDYTPGVLE